MDSQSVAEGAEVTINISLDRVAAQDASIELIIETNAIYGKHYTSNLGGIGNSTTVKLPISKGQRTVQFNISSINNNVFDNGKFLTFKLFNPSRGLSVGVAATLTLTIIDDEGPSLVNFEKNDEIINELNSAGTEVKILFSAPVKGEGSITILLHPGGALPGKDFITSPANLNNIIKLNTLPGESEASFTIIPIHNFIVTQHQQIKFVISEVGGALTLGTRSEFTLTVLNEDTEALVNFASGGGTLDENNTAGLDIVLPFSAQAPGDGSIIISFNTNNVTYGNSFTTVPPSINGTINLFVVSGQLHASFKVLPINNTFCHDEERSIQFTVASAIGSLKRGNTLNYKLTLNDDELVSVASFAIAEASVSENNNSGISVQINLSNPTQASGGLLIHSDWWAHQGKLVTVPAFDYSCYWYCYDPSIAISPGTASTTFQIIPSDNLIDHPNYVASFYLQPFNNNGCLQIAQNTKFNITIIDDD
jgi:hypothetical protein